MPRGGARPGAGRKRKPAPATPAAGPVVDAQGYKTDAAPEGWPFGKEPPAGLHPSRLQPLSSADLSHRSRRCSGSRKVEPN